MKLNMAISGFMAGLFADWATYFTTSVALAAGIKGKAPFMPFVWKILYRLYPHATSDRNSEGAMTAGMIVLLYNKRPDFL